MYARGRACCARDRTANGDCMQMRAVNSIAGTFLPFEKKGARTYRSVLRPFPPPAAPANTIAALAVYTGWLGYSKHAVRTERGDARTAVIGYV